MTHGSGGGFDGGGGGFSGGSGFSSSFEHGRTSGGSYDNHHSHHHHGSGQNSWGPSYGPGYYSSAPMYGTYLQRPSPAVRLELDRKTVLLNQTKSCFTTVLVVLFIGTLFLQFGYHASEVIALDVNSSRLVTAHSFFTRSIQFTNKGELEGPVLYGLYRRPDLDSEVRWSDYQNMTMNYWHQEYYYYLNKGSTVRMKSNVKIPDNLYVYFKVIRGQEDLDSFLDQPDAASIRLRDYIEYKYQTTVDDDHIFAFANTHHVDAEVEFELDIQSRKYNVDDAEEHYDLRDSCELKLSVWSSKYAVLETPGVGEMPVDNWQISISYGTRWMSILLGYASVILIYLATKHSIMRSIHDIEVDNAERAPILSPTDDPESTPTAPVISSSMPQEEEYPYRKDKEIEEDHLCSVCFDAPKDSFFVPCGHRATCHACGLRISGSDAATCPICRQPITEVKKIYDA